MLQKQKLGLVKKCFLILITLLPVCYYFLTVWKYTVNVPVVDDYDVILSFINDFYVAETWEMKLALLNKPVNMHKVVPSRLIIASMLSTKCYVDLRWVVKVGNLFLVPIAFLFFISIDKSKKYWLFSLAASAFILFNFHYYSFIFLPIVPIQFATSTAFSLMCLWSLIQKRGIGMSICSGILLITSILSNTNAILLIAIGFFHILYSKEKRVKLVVWTIASIIAVCLYNYGNQGYAQTSFLSTIIHDPIHVIRKLAVLLGNSLAIRLPEDIIISEAFGYMLMIVSVGILVKFKLFLKEKPFLFYCFLLFLFTAVMVAIGRANLPLGQGLSFRYRFNATLLVLSICLMLYAYMKERTAVLIHIVLAILIYYTSMTHYKRIGRFTSEIYASMQETLEGKDAPLYYPNQERAKAILEESIGLEVWRPEVLPRNNVGKHANK